MKPHITSRPWYKTRIWDCRGMGFHRSGATPQQAYKDWLARVLWDGGASNSELRKIT